MPSRADDDPLSSWVRRRPSSRASPGGWRPRPIGMTRIVVCAPSRAACRHAAPAPLHLRCVYRARRRKRRQDGIPLLFEGELFFFVGRTTTGERSRGRFALAARAQRDPSGTRTRSSLGVLSSLCPALRLPRSGAVADHGSRRGSRPPARLRRDVDPACAKAVRARALCQPRLSAALRDAGRMAVPQAHPIQVEMMCLSGGGG